MSLFFTLLIIFSCILLFGIGMYIVLQRKPEEETTAPSIYQSGVYSLLRKSPNDNLRKAKPTSEDIKAWLLENNIEPNIAEQHASAWEEMILQSIRIVEEGDAEGTQTYRFNLSEKDLEVCSFLNADSYITREMIYNHPELLPPFYIGSKASLISKEAWDNKNKSGWSPILPVNGQYNIPDWRTFA